VGIGLTQKVNHKANWISQILKANLLELVFLLGEPRIGERTTIFLRAKKRYSLEQSQYTQLPTYERIDCQGTHVTPYESRYFYFLLELQTPHRFASDLNQ